MSGDDDFDDFLARRKPLFERPAARELEPPEDVDRLVLRQAREAIRPSKSLHEIHGPGWGMPLALAASMLVAVTIVLNVMVAKKVDDNGAAIRQVSQRQDSPAAPNNSERPSADSPAPSAVTQPDLATASPPAWRRDTHSWLAEIDKLRAQGKNAEADAELAEYKRQHRAYASSPDR